jgi:pimeloyl-ACP methyl ester carboxylesterase
MIAQPKAAAARARRGRRRRGLVRTETVPGEVALHLERQGQGPLVLLLHGFGGSARNWRAQARALRDRYEVALPDVRGHARSDAPDDPEAYRPDSFVADVARVFDHCAARSPLDHRTESPLEHRARAVVGGLSMGAGIAARFAAAHPGRVRALVLAALPPGAEEGTRQRSWALAFAQAIEREGLDAAGARYAWGPESGLDEVAAKLVRLGFREHAPHAIAHTLRGLLAVQPGWRAVADALAPLALPTLVLVGEKDRVSRGPSEALAHALPHADLRVVAGAGHVVNLEAREEVNALLRRFLDALPPEP